ncbi:MAG: hypothetical protein SFY69_01610 [Planctomycetota bacterium]|nr:hypothetical protein [Planctomycetota bacterium]
MRAALRTLAAGVCVMFLVATNPGCVNSADVRRVRAQGLSLRNDLDASLRAGESQLSDLDVRGRAPDDPERLRTVSQVELLRARRAELDRALADLDAEHAAWLADADPEDPLARALRDATPRLPDPLSTPVLLGGALLAAALRARQLKTALVSVAESIEKAKQTDDVFRERFAQAAPTIRSIQTPAARRIVDTVTSEGFHMRLPL